MIQNLANVFHLSIRVVVDQQINLFKKADVKNYVKNQLKISHLFLLYFDQENKNKISFYHH